MATRRKKTPAKPKPRKAAISARSPSDASSNSGAAEYWKTYRILQKKVDHAWQQVQDDVRTKAPAEVLVRSKNELLLLLGECNYMAKECMRLANARKRK